jgi:type IV pilus assembly protein PilB
LSKLGLEGDDLDRFRQIIKKPHGVILVTGPTGSGKTTTLYAALSEMNSKEESIFTLEDPIEYDLAGIRQVQVRPDFGLSFSDGLRSLLRQDPDTILVGEIRDQETAELAIRASLTGHLVLSTLHTNSAVGAIPRLVNMGVESYLLSSALLMVVGQRLVRKICPECKTDDLKFESQLQLLRQVPPEGSHFKKGQGCSHCNSTGYLGRVAIYETLEIDDEIREAMIEKISESQLRNLILAKGKKLMIHDGLAKAANGLTTLSEVQRLVG